MIALFLPAWLLTVLLETAVLVVGLSRHHAIVERLYCGFWLSSATLPVVWFVLPGLVDPLGHRAAYLAVAETFAPAAECGLFAARHRDRTTRRDLAAIVLANLVSSLVGEVLWRAA